MPRKTAGARYPHASSTARQHDHRWCPVVDAVAALVEAGKEDWGTPHPMPILKSAEQAQRIRRGLFRGRDCAKIQKQHGELSVSVKYRDANGDLRDPGGRWMPPIPDANGTYSLVVFVWQRPRSKKEIVRRVKNGEKLPYNVMREN